MQLSNQKKKAKNILKEKFGHHDFRPFQLDIIINCLEGKDVFVVMATGSGKSLCYQIPPLVSNKTMIVISPLISLMEDQVASLIDNGVAACQLSSTQANKKVWEDAKTGKYSLIYMTPERVQRWCSNIQQLCFTCGVVAFAIDESHCISEWGNDFRPSYRTLNILREKFPKIPIIALTATATKRVQKDIISNLNLSFPLIIRKTFNRPNLSYEVKMRTTLRNDLTLKILDEKSTIIYCLSRKGTEEIANHLNKLRYNSAKAYHAGQNPKDKTSTHMAFKEGTLDCIVATVAFSMGIDKPNIRRIIHYGMPKSIETYYQQTGRAGRDGENSECIMFYSPNDFSMGNFYTANIKSPSVLNAFQNMYDAMKKYTISTECRRKYLLSYFDEYYKKDNCNSCDNCKDGTVPTQDITSEARWFALAAKETGERFGVTTLIDVLYGSKAEKLSQKILRYRSSTSSLNDLKSFGKLSNKPKTYIKALAIQLEYYDVIKKVETTPRFPICKLGKKGKMLINNSNYKLAPIKISDGMKSKVSSKNQKNIETKILTKEDQLYNMLQLVCKQIARNHRIAPYRVFSDGILKKLAKHRPVTKNHMGEIGGVSNQKLNKYGETFSKKDQTLYIRKSNGNKCWLA